MMIELSSVNKVYNGGEPNEVHALHDVSLQVSVNEMVCLCGPSGSGKTTILSIIGCVVQPSSGRATLAGKKISRLPDHHLCLYRRQMIGFIFQNFQLIPELSVEENITLPLYPSGLSPQARRKKAEPLIERLGLEKRRSFPVSKISGGELQRVAICRALIHDPPLVLADEPTAHLDSVLAEQFMAIMGELKAMGKTVILTSHDNRVFTHPAVDRIVNVADGRITTIDKRAQGNAV